ncbi:MAG TPA: crosslink repair DNA glycosylase YcaQ family protein [Candidatus Bathyarchaeia archaeon]|nr:crosslink repair DNA glycosylase YcaQ family protein [Candidatus Bathyarchaeia archaeon]
MPERITTTLKDARRLAVAKQHLAGKQPSKPNAAKILEVARSLGYVQLDPISTVAPSHLIVLWSRLGNFNRSNLDNLLWRDRKLFEYWAHEASIVLMEDYPLYYSLMRRYPDSLFSQGSVWRERVDRWLNANMKVRDHVLNELRLKGPLMSRQFEDKTRAKRSLGWGSEGNVSRMLFHLFLKGEVMVVGRQGKQKLYDLPEKFLPSWVSKKELSAEQVEYIAVQRSLRTLGVANSSEISWQFLRSRYPNLKSILKATLKQLVADEKIIPVDLTDEPVGKGERYIHSDDIELLEELQSGEWLPRVSLLSPFDNLISDRTRTRLFFNFDYTTEIYTPSHKRKYGYYVMPILSGDRMIGRIDPLMDRKNGKLVINAVHAEPDPPKDKNIAKEIRDEVEQLSEFLGAKEVVYSRRVPKYWLSHLN